MVEIDVEHVAWLARLELTEEEKEVYGRQLRQILEHAAAISALDIKEVPPTSHPMPLANVMREDRVEPSLSQEEALSCAPRAEGGYFAVPRIF